MTMPETCDQSAEFLTDLCRSLGLSLQVSTSVTAEGCRLEIDGADADLLIAQGGELLDAVQHLLNQIFSAGHGGQRLVCDARGFRATREAELRAMASHAAQRVRSTGLPFSFGPMSANERRIIHLALANEADLQTESIGEGAARKLRVALAKAG